MYKQFTIPMIPRDEYDWMEKHRQLQNLDETKWWGQWVFVVAGIRALRALAKTDPDAARRLVSEAKLEKRK